MPIKTKQIITSFILLIVLFILDSSTSWELSFTLYYLLLVLMVGIKISFRWGILFCILTIISGASSDIINDYPYTDCFYFYVRHINRFIIYLVIVYMASKCKNACEYERYKSYYDYLTNIYNRRGFYHALDVERKRAQRNNTQLAVVYIDCDNFKEVNDQFGHRRGDELLVEIALMLKKFIRAIDTVARIGGDEFVVIFVDSDLKTISETVNRLHIKLTEEIKNLGFNVTFSCGLGVFEYLPIDDDEIIFLVDNLMYESKRTGKNKVSVKVFKTNNHIFT
jgi:diguanylate cyclase (GGDEF)-like protein